MQQSLRRIDIDRIESAAAVTRPETPDSVVGYYAVKHGTIQADNKLSTAVKSIQIRRIIDLQYSLAKTSVLTTGKPLIGNAFSYPEHPNKIQLRFSTGG